MMNLADLADPEPEATFVSAALGELGFHRLQIGQLSKAERAMNGDPRSFSRSLLESIAYRVIDETPLNETDALSVTDSDLETFATLFMDAHQEFQNDLTKQETETNVEFLWRGFDAYRVNLRGQIDDMTGMPSLKSTLGIGKFEFLKGVLGSTAAGKFEFLNDPFGVKGIAKTGFFNDALKAAHGHSGQHVDGYLEHEAKLKNNLASAALSDAISSPRAKIADVNSLKIDVSTLRSPIVETNRILTVMGQEISRMGDLAEKTAAMQKTLNDQAAEAVEEMRLGAQSTERNANTAMRIGVSGVWIAVASMILSALFGGLTYWHDLQSDKAEAVRAAQADAEKKREQDLTTNNRMADRKLLEQQLEIAKHNQRRAELELYLLRQAQRKSGIQ